MSRGPGRPRIDLATRFWAKVEKTETCWNWTASVDLVSGYGHISNEQRTCYAHRTAYELTVGPIPAGSMIDHKCHNRRCVNPDHLRLATNKENAEHRVAANAGNPSGVRGVQWYKPYKNWVGKVTHNGVRHHVGYFSTLAEAEVAVIAKRNELFTHNDLDRKAA